MERWLLTKPCFPRSPQLGGYLDPAGNPIAAIGGGGQGDHPAVHGLVDMVLNAQSQAVLTHFFSNNNADRLAMVCVAACSMELVASGHHYMTDNEQAQKLLAEFDALFNVAATLVGATLPQIKSFHGSRLSSQHGPQRLYRLWHQCREPRLLACYGAGEGVGEVSSGFVRGPCYLG